MVQTAGTRVDIGALTTGQPPWWRERRRAHSLECVKAGEGREKGGKTKKGFAKKRNKAGIFISIFLLILCMCFW